MAFKSGDRWIEGLSNVKAEVKSYFQDLYTDQNSHRPLLDGISFKRISLEDEKIFKDPFSLEEIKESIWNCDRDKSPGPDGFTFSFFKKFWSCIKEEIFLLVEEFYRNTALPKGICFSFVSLIPKRENPQKLSDYRPISLIWSIHKLFSNLLAARLKRVIGPQISSCQSGFISNRQILDGVLAINEIVDLARKKRLECLMLKADFEKPYDSVNWGLLKYMMRRMGFSGKRMAWMEACPSWSMEARRKRLKYRRVLGRGIRWLRSSSILWQKALVA